MSTLVFAEGFEAGTARWANQGNGRRLTPGRFDYGAYWATSSSGGTGWAMDIGFSSSWQNWIVGFAWSYGNWTGGLCQIRYDGTTQVYLHLDGSAMRFSIRRGNGEVLLAMPRVVQPSGWNYLEFKARIAVDGFVELRVNGEVWGSADHVNTTNSSQQSANHLYFLENHAYDDLVVLDGVDYWGDVRVQTLMPNGNGSYSEWLGSDGDRVDNYALVNEQPANTNNYVKSGTVGERDSYAFQDLAGAGNTVLAVNPMAYARKDDANDRRLRLTTRVSGADYDNGADLAVPSGWSSLESIWPTNPATGQAWTAAEVDGAEFGVKVAG